MEEMDHDPADPSGATVPRQSDRPPVGEPLVVSRRNPDVRPATRPVRREPRPEGELGAAGDDADVGELVGRVALVTAAAGDVGSALVRALVERGARVLGVDADLAALVAVLDASGARDGVVPLRCDLAEPDDVDSVCEFVTRSTVVDVVFHVADERAVRGADEVDRLDRLLGSEVRGPAALVSGIVSAAVADTRIVLVDRVTGSPEDEPAPPDGSAARELVRRHLAGLDRARVSTASCGPGIRPEAFASSLVGLVAVDDVPLERLVLAERSHGLRVDTVDDTTSPTPDPGAGESTPGPASTDGNGT